MGGVFRFLTAGESHGEALVAVIEGVPAGLPLTEAGINGDLARRQRGYGRGGRMKIERDQVHVLSGVRWGATLGSPITLSIANRDWENWKATMGVAVPEAGTAKKEVTRPRPGHADLAGAMKYGHRDIRNVLERSSARETTARVAVAGVAKRLLAEFGITILSHVTEIGGVRVGHIDLPWDELARRAEASEVRCADATAEAAIIAAIDDAQAKGDTLGSVFEVVERAAMKPLSTLRTPLKSVDLATKETVEAVVERSDVCAVPAAGVVGEAMMAIVLADAFLEKFGGDGIEEVRRNYRAYQDSLKSW